jgi:hypothetical protein
MNRIVVFVLVALFLALSVSPSSAADDVEIAGVTFPAQKVVEGKTLTLNGVALRKAMGFIKVYVAALYLETPTHAADEVIASQQIKHLHTHYLSSMVTAKKLQDGFIDLMKSCNPPEMFERNQADIDRYAAWLDKDMQPGLTSISTYVPGKGLTLEYQGEIRGTIANKEFIEMYYNYNVGEKADPKIKEGLLGS